MWYYLILMKCSQQVVWPKMMKALEERNDQSDLLSAHELAKTEYEEWLRNMGSGEMESKPSSTKFKFPKEAKKVYAFVMAQVTCSSVSVVHVTNDLQADKHIIEN